MNKKVLALNRAWIPVDVISYKDAFRLMCKGHAFGLETVHGTYVQHNMESWIDLHVKDLYDKLNTVSLQIPVPEIIVLAYYDKIPAKLMKFSKNSLLIRDNSKCMYCGTPVNMDSATIDHVYPQCKGGKTDWHNCVIACKKCNHEKADAHPVGKYKPKVKPKEPLTHNPICQLKKKTELMKEIPESWSKFLH